MCYIYVFFPVIFKSKGYGYLIFFLIKKFYTLDISFFPSSLFMLRLYLILLPLLSCSLSFCSRLSLKFNFIKFQFFKLFYSFCLLCLHCFLRVLNICSIFLILSSYTTFAYILFVCFQVRTLLICLCVYCIFLFCFPFSRRNYVQEILSDFYSSHGMFLSLSPCLPPIFLFSSFFLAVSSLRFLIIKLLKCSHLVFFSPVCVFFTSKVFFFHRHFLVLDSAA